LFEPMGIQIISEGALFMKTILTHYMLPILSV